MIMERFFKSNKRPEVCQVELFHGDVGENCTNSVNWIFELPVELSKELYEKYNIPKYLGVRYQSCKGFDKASGEPVFNDPEKEVLLLNFEDMTIEYTLDTYEDDDWDYEGDDYRTAKDHNGREYISIHWTYDSLNDYWGDIMPWEGYVGDEYFKLSDFDYELPEDMNGCHPSIEITGEDKDKLLELLYPIMAEVIDGDLEVKKKLYDYCGD